MSTEYRDLSPGRAWSPLPKSQWGIVNACHLLRRIGFSATPKEVERAVDRGLGATLEYYFGKTLKMPMPDSVRKYGEKSLREFRSMRNLPEDERRPRRRQLRQEGNAVFLDYGIKWLMHARQLRYAPYEKLVTFLQDVFVVGLPKVRHPYLLYRHQNLLREQATGEFGRLCRDVSRSPAMIQYLDLKRSRKGMPNENFARELFELFMLGEGNYTEKDIKEAARAFTGYKTDGADFRFAYRQHDDGYKTVFGDRGRHSGDDVIALTLKQPAAATFLPGEFLRYYLSSEIALDPPYVEELGENWRRHKFSIGYLVERVFSSRLFYHPQFRGNMIKSPVQYYIGLLQDLDLDVAPFPRVMLNGLRNMGQPFFAPPNVRGWQGGKLWINSSTLAARRRIVESIFSSMNEENLNADDYAELMVARLEDRAQLTVDRKRLNQVAQMDDAALLKHIATYIVTEQTGPEFTDSLRSYLRNGKDERRHSVENLLLSVLLSPHYNLC